MAAFDLNDVFQPSSALRTGRRDQFVGRIPQFMTALAALTADGGSLCVLGERGIGKTSFAWRVVEYLNGDEAWANEHLEVPFSVPDFDVVWLEVQRPHENVAGIILDLLTNKGRSQRWGQFPISVELEEFTNSNKSEEVSNIINSALLGQLNENLDAVDVYGDKDRLEGSVLGRLTAEQNKSLLDYFSEAVESISKKTGKKIVFFLDEIDRLPDKTGIGDFIKSGAFGKFCVIGVADRVEQLIIEGVAQDHPSAERKVTSILVDRMEKSEVQEFIGNANVKLQDIQREFDNHFAELLFYYSEGFPYIIHRLGRDALLLSLQDTTVKVGPNVHKQKTIGKKEFTASLDGFLNPNLDGAKRYQRLNDWVNSNTKEEILFALCKETGGWIGVGEIRDRLERPYGFDSSIAELKSKNLIVTSKGLDGGDEMRFFDPKLRAIVARILDRDKKLFHKKGKRNDS